MAKNSARPRVFVTQPVSEQALKRLRAVARVTLFADSSRIIPKRTLIGAVRKADILFCLLHDKIDRDVIMANPNLRLIAAQSITPSNIDVETATARRIPVTVTAPITTEATADLTFGLMLAVARRMLEGDRMARAGKFPGGQSAHLMGSFVWGKTLGLDRRRRPDRQGGGQARPRFLDARAVLDAAAQTGARGARSRAHLRAARPIAARIRFRLAAFAAQQGHAASDRRPRAAADEKDGVSHQHRARRRSSTRPPWCARCRKSRSPAPASTCSSTSPRSTRRSTKMSNVVLTPHLGSATPEVREAMANIVVDNILAFLGGHKLPNCVNPQVFAL